MTKLVPFFKKNLTVPCSVSQGMDLAESFLQVLTGQQSVCWLLYILIFILGSPFKFIQIVGRIWFLVIIGLRLSTPRGCLVS